MFSLTGMIATFIRFVTSSFFEFPSNLLQNLRITFTLNEADKNDPFGRNIQAANSPPKSSL